MTTSPPPEPIILKHKIDPLIDCVFKALFGEEENKPLLIHFLNSILRPASPIVHVTLINTAHEVPQLDGKLTTVDIKAQDHAGAIFHVEVQLAIHPSRNERMLFYWATMYGRQLAEGQRYHLLQPVTSIWVFRKPIWKDDLHHHRFQAWDPQANLRLSHHLSIHTLELEKWRPPEGEASGEDLWLHFLRDARDWQSLPEPLLHQPQMRQAMSTLKKFSDDQLEFFRYFARLDAERVQYELEDEAASAKEQAAAAKEQAAAAKEQAAAAKEQAAAAKEQAAAAKEQAAQEARAREAAQQQAAAAQQQAEAAQQQATAAQQQATAAQQQAAASQEQAAQEARAREAAQQQAAAAQQQAAAAQQQLRDAEQRARDTLRDTLHRLYEARFGPIPTDLSDALTRADALTLSQYLPRFAADPADALRALCVPSP